MTILRKCSKTIHERAKKLCQLLHIMKFNHTTRLGLFLLFFSLTISLTAQTSAWDSLYRFTNDSLINKRRYDEAFTLCEENLKRAETDFGKAHSNYAKTVLQLWGIFYRTNKIRDGIKLLTDYLPVLKNSSYKDSIYHGQTLNYLGMSYRKIDSLKRAENLYFEALAQHKQAYPIEYSAVLNNLGTLYYDSGKTDEGIEYLIKSLSYIPKTSPNYINRLANLGMLYQNKGRFKEALQTAHEVLLNTPKTDVNYFKRLSNLSFLYSQIKLYHKALEYINQGYEIVKQNKNSTDYRLCIINLANTHLQLGDYEKAKNFALEAVNIEESKKVQFVDYDFSVALLADCYNYLSKQSEALPLALEAVRLTAAKKGKTSWDYFYSLGVLARIYEKTDQVAKALVCYQEFIDAAKTVWSPTEDRYISTLKNVIPLYNSQNQVDKSTALLKELAESMNTQVVYNLDVLDEYSKELFVNSFIKDYQPLLFSQIKNGTQTDTDLLKYAYEAELAIKGVVLGSTQLFRQLANKTQNMEQQSIGTEGVVKPNSKSENESSKLFKEWTNFKGIISNAYTHKNAQNHIDSLNNQLAVIEEKLIALMPEMQRLKRKITRFEDVKLKLAPDACAIEFVHFKYFSHQGETDTVLYGALIVRPDKSYPEFVYLCTEHELGNFMKNTQNSNALQRAMTRGSAVEKDVPKKPTQAKRQRPKRLQVQNDTEGSVALYNLIWKPLQTYLDKATIKGQPFQTIYYTPSGLLHRVAFAALSINETDLLSDNYDLYALSSTRELIDLNVDENLLKQTSNTPLISLYGGIQYDDLKGEKPKIDSGNANAAWRYLEGTKREIDRISTLFMKKNIPFDLKEGLLASEDGFKAQNTEGGKSSPILHISTHGFFFQNIKDSAQKQSAFQTANNPLIRSGLIMAGANTVWLGGKPQEGKEDGILTAYEISNMDLSQTHLVVMSACETGLGDIQGTEGVYGLQRAFKMAGVDYILMSLWQVPDKQTAELMEKFYSNLLNGASIQSAFAKAQQSMKERYSPFYWAGFVLIR